MNIQNIEVGTGADEIPPLPHLVANGTSVQIGVVFDRNSVAPLLPQGLELPAIATGGFNFVDGPDGWGLTPYRMLLIWLDIDGYLSDTGQSCRYKVYVCMDGDKRAVRHYRAEAGPVSLVVDSDRVTATAGPPDREVCARVHIVSPAAPTPDTRNYVMRDDLGTMNLCPVSSLSNRSQCDTISVELPSGHAILERLRPVRLDWAWFKRNLSFTCGAWIPLRQAERSKGIHGRTMFVNFLSRFDRGVALVKEDGHVVMMNGLAERLIGDGLRLVGGRLHATHPGSDATLRGIVDSVLSGSRREAGRLERRDDSAPLIVKGMPFELDLPGTFGADPSKLVLLVFADPGGHDSLDTVPSLQLLGLTLSEAKASALVGQGMSPRETAAELGLTENTVRTTIKRVFAKLELSRQSELAVLVARVASISS